MKAITAPPAPDPQLAGTLGKVNAEPSWIEAHAGDISSVLAMAGTAASFIAPVATLAPALLGGSIAAGAVDTAMQAYNVYDGHRHGSNLKTIAYAATGIMPASNLVALKGVRTITGFARHASDALWLSGNVGFVGLETAWKGPSMVSGNADVSDWLAYGAAVTGLMKHR